MPAPAELEPADFSLTPDARGSSEEGFPSISRDGSNATPSMPTQKSKNGSLVGRETVYHERFGGRVREVSAQVTGTHMPAR